LHAEDLAYADDLALVSHSLDQMQQKTQCVEEFARSVGLRINTDKTKIMGVKINPFKFLDELLIAKTETIESLGYPSVKIL